MGAYLLIGAVAGGITAAVTPLVRRLAERIGAVVPPNPRGVHTRPMPTLGGAAMFLGFCVAMLVASQVPRFAPMFDGSSEPAGIMLAAGLMFAVGALDDLREWSPPAKIAGMVVAGGILSLFGVQMLFFRVPFAGNDTIVLSADLAPLVTVVMVVLFANAVNLVDGLDGLAAGIVAIAGSALFLYADRLAAAGFLEVSNVAPLVAVIAVGVCLGFLPHNFSPARIIMGDAGALMLGLLMATTTITIGGRADYQYTGTTYFFFAPLVIPLVVLGVPLLDTAFSFVRRVARRRSFAMADKDHLHHRLMRLGHGPRRTVVILWLWTALLSGVALAPAYTNEGNALVPFALGGLALALYALFAPGRRGADDGADAPDAVDVADPVGGGTDRPGAGVVELRARRADGDASGLPARRRHR